MGKTKSLTGQRFGILTAGKEVIKKNKRGDNVIYYQCACDCGGNKLVAKSSLKAGLTKSCGCLRKNKPNRTTHGKSSSREYSIWNTMIKRCTNSNCKSYPHYGGRGISFDPKWRKFEGFYEDMGDAPDGYTLERKDVNGNYCKDNCEWIPAKKQARNKTTTVRITYQGVTKLADEWSQITGIPRRVIHDRLQKGWPVEDALTIPTQEGKAYKYGFIYKGRRVTIAQLEREKGFSEGTIRHRIKDQCWSLEKAIETPLTPKGDNVKEHRLKPGWNK